MDIRLTPDFDKVSEIFGISMEQLKKLTPDAIVKESVFLKTQKITVPISIRHTASILKPLQSRKKDFENPVEYSQAVGNVLLQTLNDANNAIVKIGDKPAHNICYILLCLSNLKKLSKTNKLNVTEPGFTQKVIAVEEALKDSPELKTFRSLVNSSFKPPFITTGKVCSYYSSYVIVNLNNYVQTLLTEKFGKKVSSATVSESIVSWMAIFKLGTELRQFNWLAKRKQYLNSHSKPPFHLK